MRLPVERTPQARRDLYEIADYIAADSYSVATRFLTAAEKTFDDIGRMPKIGRSCAFVNPHLSQLRVWSVFGFEKYKVFYRVAEEQITVIRVLHAARDLEAIMEGEIGGESTENDSV